MNFILVILGVLSINVFAATTQPPPSVTMPPTTSAPVAGAPTVEQIDYCYAGLFTVYGEVAKLFETIRRTNRDLWVRTQHPNLSRLEATLQQIENVQIPVDTIQLVPNARHLVKPGSVSNQYKVTDLNVRVPSRKEAIELADFLCSSGTARLSVPNPFDRNRTQENIVTFKVKPELVYLQANLEGLRTVITSYMDAVDPIAATKLSDQVAAAAKGIYGVIHCAELAPVIKYQSQL